jgi:hypothetical protein
MMMTGDFEADRARAQEAAEIVADIARQLIAHGMDPTVLAMALLGIGSDLLGQAIGTERAVAAIKGMADDMLDVEQTEPPPTN